MNLKRSRSCGPEGEPPAPGVTSENGEFRRLCDKLGLARPDLAESEPPIPFDTPRVRNSSIPGTLPRPGERRTVTWRVSRSLGTRRLSGANGRRRCGRRVLFRLRQLLD